MAKQSGGAFSTVSMIVAFIVMGLFLYWLSMVSEPSETAVAVEETADPTAPLREFAMNPMAYMETPVDLDGVEVREIVGAHAFYFSFPDGTPFLVRLPGATVSQGIQVVPGDHVRVIGRVEMMSDSVLQVWDSLGVFADSAQRMSVAGASSFLAAESLQVTDPAGAAVVQDAAPAPPGQE